MIFTLRYGEGRIGIEVPDGCADLIDGGTSHVPAQEDIVQAALADANPGLEEFLAGAASVVIVVSDHTRNTGSAVYLPFLLERVRKPGRSITILVALGVHRPSSPTEIATILGCDPGDGVTVLNHDPDGHLVDCGGGLFNERAVRADRIILTGSVAFHPMAGYSGGWKSLLPGLASRESIVANHKRYFSGSAMDPRVGPACIEDNPILLDIRARTRGFADKTWCFDVVQDGSKAIVFAAAGNVDRAWSGCVGYLQRHNARSIQCRYPCVLASAGGYPADFSFYQSMKTLTNSSRACLPGGDIFLLMECRNGWEVDPEIRTWSAGSLETIALRLQADFSMSGLGMYMALSVIRSHRVHCLSSLPRDEVEALGIHHLGSAAELTRLLAASDPQKIAVMPAAAAILPVFEPGRTG
jgi:nickel-dependent lactate racemase